MRGAGALTSWVMFLGLWHKAQTLVSFQAENYPNTEAEAAEGISRALGVWWRETEKKGCKELWQLPCGDPSPKPYLAAHRGQQRQRRGCSARCAGVFRGERTCPVSVTVDRGTEATATQPRDTRLTLEAGTPTPVEGGPPGLHAVGWSHPPH